MIRPLVLAGLTSLLFMSFPGVAPGALAFSRLTERDGTTHYTNAPTDPRYQRIPGMSGTAKGWLRIPGAPSRYAEEIREISDRHGLDPQLVEAVIRVESGFNPTVVSRKGAQGLMQLMPRTASSLGVRNAFDPRQNIEGGVRHLRYLMDRYPGSPTLALAAYNAGENAVNHYRGIPPYQETQEYVRKVLQLHGSEAGTIGPPRLIYRYRDADGTLTFTNIPPPTSQRLR